MKKIKIFILTFFSVFIFISCSQNDLYNFAKKGIDISGLTPGTGILFTDITQTSMTISWGAATDTTTAQEELTYKLVRAPYPAAINTVDGADSVGGEGLVMDWTLNTLTCTVTGLAYNTTYYFAVIVKDGDDYKKLYGPASVTTLSYPAPTPGTAVSFSNITATTVTISWGAAADNSGAQSGLSYRLVRAASDTAIDTIAEASTAAADMDWSAETLTYTVHNLTNGTTYYFAVLVRDGDGNMAIYNPQSVTTIDSTPPVTGISIILSNISATTVTVSWGAASDNSTSPSDLSYKLVMVTTGASYIDTVPEADAIISAPDLAMDWSAAAIYYDISGLTEGTTYYFAVLVKDLTGNMSIYGVATLNAQTFSAVGAQQTFIVPAGVTYLYVNVIGAQGAGYNNSNVCNNGPTPPYGLGGRVEATIPVTPGETLYVYVGGQNGYNGGGLGSTSGAYRLSSWDTSNYCGNGGGASDIRQGGYALANRVIVAGGGGGAGDGSNGIGGSGGGTGYLGMGGNASGVGGPGTLSAGGAGGLGAWGGTDGIAGSLGQGGDNGTAAALGSTYQAYGNGGGGGGGYYGGGGGGSGIDGAGGGGGSSLVPGGGTEISGYQVGDGVIIIKWF